MLRDGESVGDYISGKMCIHRVDRENIFKLREEIFEQLTLFDRIKEYI